MRSWRNLFKKIRPVFSRLSCIDLARSKSQPNHDSMKQFKLSLVSVILISCVIMSCDGETNGTKATTDEWRDLFNGQDLDGWTAKFHHHEPGENYANTSRLRMA